MKLNLRAVAGAPIAVLAAASVLSGCTSAANEAAQAAYDECVRPESDVQVLFINEGTVSVQVKGDLARAMAESDFSAESIVNDSGELPESVGISLAVLAGTDCLVEQTGYPGSSDQLTDGEEWDNWRFSEESGPGSEFSLLFTSTQ